MAVRWPDFSNVPSATRCGLWGMATLTENIGSEQMGKNRKITGLSSALAAAGTIAGPVLAGFLFGIWGYWLA
jgi:MFS family permease